MRSQRKVIETVSAAASGIPDGKVLHFSWMAILCALRNKSPELFDLFENSYGSISDFEDKWGRVAGKALKRIYRSRGYDLRGEVKDHEVCLNEIAAFYLGQSFVDLKSQNQNGFEVRVKDYLQGAKRALDSELPYSYNPEVIYRPSISQYFQLVRTAGHFV